MKAMLSIMMVLLFGCSKGAAGRMRSPSAFPALNESPPPAVLKAVSDETDAESDPYHPAAVITGENWVDRQALIDEQLKGLRDYAASADEDDPFALSDEEIEALSKVDDLAIF